MSPYVNCRVCGLPIAQKRYGRPRSAHAECGGAQSYPRVAGRWSQRDCRRCGRPITEGQFGNVGRPRAYHRECREISDRERRRGLCRDCGGGTRTQSGRCRRCSGIARTTRMIVVCQRCGQVTNKRSGKYCSFACSLEARKKPPRICLGCGMSFWRRTNGTSQRITPLTGRFHSRSCAFGYWRSHPESHPAWKGGRSKLPPEPGACAVCGGTTEHRGQRYCSDAHAREAKAARKERAAKWAREENARSRGPKPPRPCVECGRIFTPTYGDKRRIYCGCNRKRLRSGRWKYTKGKGISVGKAATHALMRGDRLDEIVDLLQAAHQLRLVNKTIQDRYAGRSRGHSPNATLPLSASAQGG